MKRVEDLLIEDRKIFQDDEEYCFTSDSVLISKFATAKKNDVVADFCSGSGIVGLHFYLLNKNLVKSVDLFEMQKNLYNLSVETVEYNKLEGVIFPHNIKVQDIGTEYNGKFSLILCNPPYFKDERQEENYDKIKACKNEITINAEEIIRAAAKCLKFGGRLVLSHIPDRLPEIFSLMRQYKIEPKKLAVVTGGDKVYLTLIEGVKGGKSGLKIETVKN